METQNVDYSVENISQIFSYLKKCRQIGQRRSYRVEADGVEIVSLTSSLDPFSDFLNYRYPQCESIVLSIYRPDGVLELKYGFSLKVHAERNKRIVAILKENKHLYRENARQKQIINGLIETEECWLSVVKKQDVEIQSLEEKIEELEKGIEKSGEGKIIDAGDCYVVFVPKKVVDQTIDQQMQAASETLKMLEGMDDLVNEVLNKSKT